MRGRRRQLPPADIALSLVQSVCGRKSEEWREGGTSFLLAEDNIIVLSLHTLTQRASARERKSGLSECVSAENHKEINRGGEEELRKEGASSLALSLFSTVSTNQKIIFG